MKVLGMYYATACYRNEEGYYFTSSGLGRYLRAVTTVYNLRVVLAAPTVTEPYGHLSYPVDPLHVDVYELPYYERFQEARRVRHLLVPRLQRFLHEKKCDLLWLRYPAAYGTVVWKAAKSLGVPTFMEIVGDPVAVLKRTKRIGLIKKAIALAVAKWHERELERMIETTPTVAVSRFLRERYCSSKNFHNLTTLPCGSLYEEDFHHRLDTCENPPFRVLSVARLDHMKSLHVLIDAVGILQKRGIPLNLDIVGSGPERQFLTQRSSSALLEGSWRLHGGVNDERLHQLYCASDIFALPSIHEGLGRVYYEAMARGLPVVATWVDGIVDVVLDGVTGILVPPLNPEALASGIQTIIERPSLRRRLISNGYLNAKRFLAENFIQGLLDWAQESLQVTIVRHG